MGQAGELVNVNKRLQSNVLRLVSDRLVPHGWKQISGEEEFVRPVTSEIDARVDLAFSFYDDPLRANVGPYVAVVHHAIEEARRFIIGRPLYTVNEQLQSLMNDTHAHYRWTFIPADDMREPANRLADDALEYAPSFYEKFRTLDDVVRSLEVMAKGKRTIMKESLAIAYCIQGRLDEALVVLADDIAAMRSSPIDVANERLPRYTELFGLKFD